MSQRIRAGRFDRLLLAAIAREQGFNAVEIEAADAFPAERAANVLGGGRASAGRFGAVFENFAQARGEFVGVGFLTAVQNAQAQLSWTDAFVPLSWRAALAGASVAMGIWWYYADEDGKKSWIPLIMAGLGVGMLLWKTAMGIL